MLENEIDTSNQLEDELKDYCSSRDIGGYCEELLTLFNKYASEREKEARADEINQALTLAWEFRDDQFGVFEQRLRSRLAKLKEGKE